MIRGNGSRQPNVALKTSRNQPRGAATAFPPNMMSEVRHHHSNKKGSLPYIPSTPSTRSSDSGTSYGSRRLNRNSFDVEDGVVVAGDDRDRYEYEERPRQQQQIARKEGRRPNNTRGRSESPTKQADRTNYQTSYHTVNGSKVISVSDHSHFNSGEYQQGHPTPVFYVPSRTQNSHSNNPQIVSSNASQSTASTSSSHRQLITNVKSSSSSISTFGSTSTNGNDHRLPLTRHHSHPDSVQEEYMDDNIEEESSMEEDDTEAETIHTRPMVRYKTTTKLQQYGNAEQMHKVEASEEEEDSSPFFNESFDTVDFGSTTGVAPVVTALTMVGPKGVTQRPEPRYRPQEVIHYEDQQELYYEDEDNGIYYEDEELLYENSGDNHLSPEYDDDNYNIHGEEEYYGDENEVRVAEVEQLHRAVRRGSALAYTTGGAHAGHRNHHPDNNDHHGPNGTDRKPQRPIRPETIHHGGMNLPSTMQQARVQQQQQPLPLPLQSQPAIPIVRRQQISRSMASKRHLIAASARGVVATRATNTSNPPEMETPPIPSKQRGMNNEVPQQQQRQRVIKASSYGDIERPSPPLPSSRGRVTKAASHNTALQNPPRSRPHQHTRSSSIRGNSDFAPSDSPQAEPTQTSIRRTNSSRGNNAVDEVGMQRRAELPRSSVRKAVTNFNRSISPQNQTVVRRHSVSKAASYLESSLDTAGLQPQQGRSGNNNGSGRRNKMDLSDVNNKCMLPPPVQQRGIPSSSSSRRRSLEHVPSSFRSNAPDTRYLTNQRQCETMLADNDCEYDFEDDHNYLGVREGIQPKMDISHRRMSAGYLPSTASTSTKRSTVPQRRGQSMDLTINDIVQHHNEDEHDEQRLHDISFSDLAVRRF